MVHVKWPSPSFKVDLDHENDNIMKNGFYQRILQPSEHLKRVGAKILYFFKTLLDGPLLTQKSHQLNFKTIQKDFFKVSRIGLLPSIYDIFPRSVELNAKVNMILSDLLNSSP